MTLIYFSSFFSQHLTWRDIQHLIVRSSQPLDPSPVGRYALCWRPRPTWRINRANVLGICQFPSNHALRPQHHQYIVHVAWVLFCGLDIFHIFGEHILQSEVTLISAAKKKRQFICKVAEHWYRRKHDILDIFNFVSSTQENCPVDDSWITNLWKAQ